MSTSLRSLPFSEFGRFGITNQTHPKSSKLTVRRSGVDHRKLSSVLCEVRTVYFLILSKVTINPRMLRFFRFKMPLSVLCDFFACSTKIFFEYFEFTAKYDFECYQKPKKTFQSSSYWKKTILMIMAQGHRFQIFEKLGVNSLTYLFELNGFKET